MVSTERFSNLPEHMWPRLRALLDSHPPGGEPLSLALGEPTHPFPSFVTDAIVENAAGFNKYPPNNGTPELLEAMANWVQRRYGVSLDPDKNLMALNGTREGLFNALVSLLPGESDGQPPAVIIPNPFYPVYMIGSLAVEAEPIFLPATAANGFMPEVSKLDTETLNRTAVVFLCSPSNV